MPNQRKKGKKHVGAYVPEKMVDALQSLAEKGKLDKSALFRQFIYEGLQRRGVKVDEERKS